MVQGREFELNHMRIWDKLWFRMCVHVQVHYVYQKGKLIYLNWKRDGQVEREIGNTKGSRENEKDLEKEGVGFFFLLELKK